MNEILIYNCVSAKISLSLFPVSFVSVCYEILDEEKKNSCRVTSNKQQIEKIIHCLLTPK